MPYISSPVDQALLYYADYKPSLLAQQTQSNIYSKALSDRKPMTIIFIHGWPMSGKMFEHLMLPLCEDYGIRCIAIDRRGFGRSDWNGKNGQAISYQTFAIDTIHILANIDGLDHFIFVAASMGCGETILVKEMLAQQSLEQHCKGFVWLGPSMPFPLQTDNNPSAPSRELWESILVGLRNDRAGFVSASIGGVFGIPLGISMNEAAIGHFIRMIEQADSLAMERCIRIIIAEDFTEKLKVMGTDLKLLILHGDRDQGMPAEASTHLIKGLVPTAMIKIYEKAAHGLYWTHASQVMKDLLEFLNTI